MNQLITINTDQGLIISNPRDNYYHNTISFLNYLDGQIITEPMDLLNSIRSYFQHLNTEYKAGRYKARTVIIKRAAVKNRIKKTCNNLTYELNLKLNHIIKQIEKEIPEPKVNTCIITESKVVSLEEYEDLLRACNTERQRLYISFLIHSALRIDELVNIRFTDIKKEGLMSEITVRGKGTKERIIRIETSIIDEVKTVFRGKVFLFETEKNRQCNKNYISNIITKIGKRINRNISAHTFRHSWATIAYKKHPDKIKELSRFMGHSDIKTFLSFYAHNQLTDIELTTIIN